MLTGTPCINTYICIHRCTKYLLLLSHLRISSRHERRGGPSKCHAETFLLIHAKWTVLRSFAFLFQFFFFFLIALSRYQRCKGETSYSYCTVHTVESSLFKLIGRRNSVWIRKFSDMKFHLFEWRLRLIDRNIWLRNIDDWNIYGSILHTLGTESIRINFKEDFVILLFIK